MFSPLALPFLQVLAVSAQCPTLVPTTPPTHIYGKHINLDYYDDDYDSDYEHGKVVEIIMEWNDADGGGSTVSNSGPGSCYVSNSGPSSSYDSTGSINRSARAAPLLASLVTAQQGCVALGKFGKVDWSEEKVDFCIYQSIEKTCEVKSEEVCVPVPVTTCELHSYTECAHVELSTFQVANDRTETLEFVPNKCMIGEPGLLVDFNTVPELTEDTKEVCDSEFIVNVETGQKAFSRSINCRNETFKEYKLVTKRVEETLLTWDCTPTDPLPYDSLVKQTDSVTTHATDCIPKVVPLCTSRLEEMCKVVEWEECREEAPVESCHNVVFHTPNQRKLVTLKCPLNFAAGEAEGLV